MVAQGRARVTIPSSMTFGDLALHKNRRSYLNAASALAVLGCISALTSPDAFAQSFPTKPIRLICPFPPGGAVDIASRAVAAELSKQLGQTVQVDNRPGAGGNIGLGEAARAAPDGYTLFMTTSGIQAINPTLYGKKMPVDPNRDLQPIAALVSLNNVLVLHPSVPAKDMKEFMALLRANPGKFNYGSSGSGTSIHMSAEMFKYLTKTFMTHIPYRGSAPAVTDLLGGQISIMFDNIPSALPHIKAGKLRAIATTGSKRDATLPDLPTISESGVVGYESGVWFGLATPVGVPKELVDRLSAEAQKATKSPDFIKRMSELGYNILGTNPDQMIAMVQAELKRWPPVIKASGATAD
jgi:tripartite-type tricarboxylate transporter receptor subunit TctC